MVYCMSSFLKERIAPWLLGAWESMGRHGWYESYYHDLMVIVGGLLVLGL